jgi:hypothetical protein
MPNINADPNDLSLRGESGIKNHFGAIVYGSWHNHSVSIPMNSLSTVFLAEVMAILKCTELLMSQS